MWNIVGTAHGEEREQIDRETERENKVRSA